MVINHNMLAINTTNALGRTSGTQAKSMEKLSSGLRINRAGDDAAGLAISEKMRGQIKGLNQASRNAQDGISMIQTAEGALNETQSILQRMRELSVQSSNDTNIDADREAIQNEIEQLKSEINRIGETTEFNKQKLLQGDGKSSIDKTGISSLKNLVKLENGAEATTVEAKRTDAITVANIANNETLEYNINGETVKVSFAVQANPSAATNADGGVLAAKDADGNYVVTVTNEKGTGAAPTDAQAAAALKSALELAIEDNEKLKGNFSVSVATNNVSIEAASDGDFAGAKGYINAPVEKVGTTVQTTNNIAAAGTGPNAPVAGKDVEAVKSSTSLDLSGLLGADGDATDANLKDLVGKGITLGDKQIEFYNSNDGAYKGDAVGVDISSALADDTDANKVETLIDSIVAQSDKLGNVTLKNSTGTTDELEITAKEGGLSGDKIEVKDGGAQEQFKASFQIGANEDQTMEISIGDMRAEALGVKDIDLTSREGAEAAITTVNDAITKVSTQRSELGAFQNRLEHTINNLDTSSENLQAAESRIRDVDMAKEMVQLTKNNILQQAAQSMLAQANQAPQGVLGLLR